MSVFMRNISSYSNNVSSWSTLNILISDVSQFLPFISGNYKSYRFDVRSTTSNSVFANQVLSSGELLGTNVESKTLAFGVWLWTDSGQPFVSSDYTLNIVSSGMIMSKPFSLSNIPKLVYGISSINPSSASYTIEIATTKVLSQYLYAAAPHTGLGDDYLVLDTDQDLKLDSEKIENEHRTRSGRKYVYKWGDFQSVKFGLSFVSSHHRNIINNKFWSENSRVLFGASDGSTIVEGLITNDKTPIDMYEVPYLNLWKGKIDLAGGF